MRLPRADRWIAEHAPGVIFLMAILHLPVAGFGFWYYRSTVRDIALGNRDHPATDALAVAICTIGMLVFFSGAMSILRGRDTIRAIRAGDERSRWVEPLVTMASLIVLTIVLIAALMVDTFLVPGANAPSADLTAWLVVAAAVSALAGTAFYLLGVFFRRAKVGPPLLMDVIGTVAVVGAVGCIIAIGVVELLL